MQHTDRKMQRQVLSVEVTGFWCVPLPNAMCFKACRKCLNTGLIVGPRKRLIMGEKEDEGRSIGVVRSNLQETFEEVQLNWVCLEC